MTDARAVLWSGPLDGHTIEPRALPFLWIVPVVGGVRAYDKPADKRGRRLLYRRESNTRFVFAGYTYALCEECDNPQPKNEQGECGLCGAKLIPV